MTTPTFGKRIGFLSATHAPGDLIFEGDQAVLVVAMSIRAGVHGRTCVVWHALSTEDESARDPSAALARQTLYDW